MDFISTGKKIVAADASEENYFPKADFKNVEVHLPDMARRFERDCKDIYDRKLQYLNGATLRFGPEVKPHSDYMCTVFARTRKAEELRVREGTALRRAISTLQLPEEESRYFSGNQIIPCRVVTDDIISNGPRFYLPNGTLFSFKYVHPLRSCDIYPAEDYSMRLGGKWNFGVGAAIVKAGLIVRVYGDYYDKVGRLGQIKDIYINNPEKMWLYERTDVTVVLTDGRVIDRSSFIIVYEPIDGCECGYVRNSGYIGDLQNFPYFEVSATKTIVDMVKEKDIYESHICGNKIGSYSPEWMPIMSHPIWIVVDGDDDTKRVKNYPRLAGSSSVTSASAASQQVGRVHAAPPAAYKDSLTSAAAAASVCILTSLGEDNLIPIPENNVLFAAFLYVDRYMSSCIKKEIRSLEELGKQDEDHRIIYVTEKEHGFLTNVVYTTADRRHKIDRAHGNLMKMRGEEAITDAVTTSTAAEESTTADKENLYVNKRTRSFQGANAVSTVNKSAVRKRPIAKAHGNLMKKIRGEEEATAAAVVTSSGSTTTCKSTNSPAAAN
jgi:hypothetical protein